MNNEFYKIKNNVKFVSESEHVLRSILNGQIEETAILHKQQNLEYRDAARIFMEIFDRPLLSREYILFCEFLDKKGCFGKFKKWNSFNVRTVSLIDNLYSKDAFQSFNKKFTLVPDYENSFASLCEAVYSNRSFYAILPLFNTLDGLITSVYRLIQKYELKIVASTKVSIGTGETETEFVLVTHHKSEFVSNDRFLVSITHNYGESIIDLMASLKPVNVFPCSINTLPLSYTDDRCESIITFDTSACGYDALCCFFETALPQSNIVGIYSIVK